EFTAPGIGALKEKLDYLKMDENERRRFDRHVDHARSEWGMIAYAREKGHKEGVEEGIEKGREEGMKQGAHQKAMEIALALKQKGFSLAQISDATGIPLPELED
ncbi:MAG: conserved hypothetical protein (putative transposase or invertase), partial [Candidatus Kentron sp. G]